MAKRVVPTTRTLEEKQKLVAEVQAAIKGGLSTKAAVEQTGINLNQFYRYQTELKKKPRKRRTSRSEPTMLTIPLPSAPAGSMLILYGNPNDITHALDKMAQIGR